MVALCCGFQKKVGEIRTMKVVPPFPRYMKRIERGLRATGLYYQVLKKEELTGIDLMFAFGWARRLKFEGAKALFLELPQVVFLRSNATYGEIVHETLHFLYPDWSEKEVEEKQWELLKESGLQRRLW